MVLSQRAPKTVLQNRSLTIRLNETAAAFAREDLAEGSTLLRALLLSLPADQLDELTRSVLDECVSRLEAAGVSRLDYVLISLQALARSRLFSSMD